MGTNGKLGWVEPAQATPQQQLEYLDRQLRKLEIKKRGLEESRRELINRYNLNKVSS